MLEMSIRTNKIVAVKLRLLLVFLSCAALAAPQGSFAGSDLAGRKLWPTLPSSEVKILILEYHAISPPPDGAEWPDLYVTKEVFVSHLKIISDLGLQGISFIDCIDMLKAGNYDTTKIVFTFDDGYSDNYQVAQILKGYGYGATFFIPTFFPGRKYPKRSITYMPWNNIREIFRMGFEIGSHTVDHIPLGLASSDRVIYEIEQSKKDIEQQLSSVDDPRPKIPLTFSIPMGSYNTDVIKDIEKFGFEGCVTSNRGLLNVMHLQKAPRMKIEQNTDISLVLAHYLRTNLKSMGELKRGDKGSRIRSFRTILTRLGHPLSDSDTFDEKMEKAVMDFQKQFRLHPSGVLNLTTIDRIVSDFVDMAVTRL